MSSDNIKLTVISHIYNEEYLLPFWLEYHSLIFDDGIIIDYLSNDKSLNIIKKICPHWKIIKTKNITNDNKPNFDAMLVDYEVTLVEKCINNFKICLNTTEFLIIDLMNKQSFLNNLDKNKCYGFEIYSIMSNKNNFYPANLYELLMNFNLIKSEKFPRGHRYLHSKSDIQYSPGRHSIENNNIDKIYLQNEYVIWLGFYPWNQDFINRKLQIQNNIPITDKFKGFGSQHFTNIDLLNKKYKSYIEEHCNIELYNNICNTIQNTSKYIYYNTKIYHPSLMGDYNWGDDNIILNNDKNLLEDTDFDNVGYKVFDIKDMHDMNIRLQNILKEEIYKVCNKNINLEKYHNEITEDEHKIILNSMPYKKNSTDKINEFGNYIIDFVSSKLNKKIKIFNDDIWFRICRPSKNYMNDFNPCHKDIYLDFYRNVINIYLPIVGSNENSTLMIEQSSHKWNENETIVTKDGAYFKNINKKYSVDAVVASKKPLNMYRPNPSIDQVMIFSPYLIHGCANNNNEDTTRISIEIRFIMDDNSGINQENDFNKFLKMRHWR
jgi:hypothetical protein